MKIKAEYVCMGVYVARDDDMDPEENVYGAGRSKEEAVDKLVEELIERAEEKAYGEGYDAAINEREAA